MTYQNKKFITPLIIFLIGLFCGIVINQSLFKKSVAPSQPVEKNQTNNTINDEAFPWLDLPVEYFSNKDVQWGSAGKGNGDKITDYTQVAIKNMAVYQSYPSLTPTIENYENKIVPLKNLTSAQIKQEISKIEDYGQPRVEDSFKEFGSLVSNYIPEGKYIWKIEKFDVDGDGVAESIVSTNYSGAADGGSYSSDIIKGNNIVFSVKADNSSIIPADTSNGFYIEWGAVGPNTGRCCEEGIKRTRFVFKDGKFTPIYEQEVKYLKIGKE